MKRPYWRRTTTGPRAGFTLLELLAVIAIIVVVTAILLPTIHKTRGEPAYRVHCASNLRQIGQAILLYANDNKGAYPRVVYVPDNPPVWGTGANSGNPFSGANAPSANDVTAAMFLLLRTQEISPEAFVCPKAVAGGDETPDRFGGGGLTALNRSNFTDWRRNLSYSLANPYPGKTATEQGYKWDSTLGVDFVVAADINPGIGDGSDVTFPDENSGSKEMQKANSPNHQGAGQNILYGDGHVDFQPYPFSGAKRDNIYTVAGVANGEPTTTSKTVVGLPTWAGDSVLLPALK